MLGELNTKPRTVYLASCEPDSVMSTLTTDILDNTTSDPRQRAPLVLGTQTLASVTDTVCRLAERPRPTRAWCIAFAVSSTFTVILMAMIGYLFWNGIGVLGREHPRRLGLRYHQFCLVDRNRPCRHAHLRHPLPFPAELAEQHQPLRRSHDDSSPSCAPASSPAIHIGRPWLVYWLFPYPQPDEHLAAIPQPSALGRLRRQHLLHRLAALLVHRHDSRSRLPPRSGRHARASDHLRRPCPGLARLAAPLASL